LYVSDETVAMQLGAALVIGVVAAVFPAWRASRVPVVEGLRAIA
jgi:putative ABC transport system permease protein